MPRTGGAGALRRRLLRHTFAGYVIILAPRR